MQVPNGSCRQELAAFHTVFVFSRIGRRLGRARSEKPQTTQSFARKLEAAAADCNANNNPAVFVVAARLQGMVIGESGAFNL